MCQFTKRVWKLRCVFNKHNKLHDCIYMYIIGPYTSPHMGMSHDAMAHPRMSSCDNAIPDNLVPLVTCC